MKIVIGANRRNKAFTLIEMIGVLAVIAILAALLIPKIFEAINSARINNCIVSYNTIKTAAMDHYGKYGAINSFFGTNTMTGAQVSNYDGTLLSEGFIDKPFSVKIGTSSLIRAVAPGSTAGTGGFYSLSTNANNDCAGASLVLEAVISGVAPQDALDLSTRLDGTTLSAASNTNADLNGRVEYVSPSGSPATTTVYMYITHR